MSDPQPMQNQGDPPLYLEDERVGWIADERPRPNDAPRPDGQRVYTPIASKPPEVVDGVIEPGLTVAQRLAEVQECIEELRQMEGSADPVDAWDTIADALDHLGALYADLAYDVDGLRAPL